MSASFHFRLSRVIGYRPGRQGLRAFGDCHANCTRTILLCCHNNSLRFLCRHLEFHVLKYQSPATNVSSLNVSLARSSTHIRRLRSHFKLNTRPYWLEASIFDSSDTSPRPRSQDKFTLTTSVNMADPCSNMESCPDAASHLQTSNRGLVIGVALLLVLGLPLFFIACIRPCGIFFLNLWSERKEKQKDVELGIVRHATRRVQPSSDVWWQYDDFVLNNPSSVDPTADTRQVQVPNLGVGATMVTAEDIINTGIFSGLPEEVQRSMADRCFSDFTRGRAPTLQRRHSVDLDVGSSLVSDPPSSPEPEPRTAEAGADGRRAKRLHSLRRRAFSESYAGGRFSGEHPGARRDSLELYVESGRPAHLAECLTRWNLDE